MFPGTSKMAQPEQFISPALLDEASPQFDSLDEAAHALHGTIDKTNRGSTTEQAAVVLHMPNGKYQYSTVVPQVTRDTFALRVRLPHGASIAGIYHTHPGDDSLGQVFSPADLETAQRLNVPSYVTFLKDGSIRKFVPGVTKITTIGDGTREWRRAAVGDPLTLPTPPPTAQTEQSPAEDETR